MKNTEIKTPSIYVGTYSKYNDGNLAGEWVDLTQFSDKSEFIDYITELHKDEKDPEFMFQDWEHILESLISESWIDDNIFEALEILGKIEDMDNSDLVNLHNQYCQNNNLYDDEIYYNDDDFFNTHFEGRTMEAVRAAVHGDFNFGHEWVTFNGYANLQSIPDYKLSDYIDKEAITKDVLENKENYSL